MASLELLPFIILPFVVVRVHLTTPHISPLTFPLILDLMQLWVWLPLEGCVDVVVEGLGQGASHSSASLDISARIIAAAGGG